MQSSRLAPHNAFTRETQIRGKPGIEAQITIKSVACRHGKCTFCGLGKIDAEYTKPLDRKEFLSQLAWAKDRIGSEPLGKVSILVNSHSAFEPDAVRWRAFVDGMRFVRGNFPDIAQLSVESRIEAITTFSIFRITSALGSPPQDFLELAVGVESGDEKVRNGEMLKGVSDRSIYEAARMLADQGWAMRAYYIYNCPGRPFDARTGDFIRMAEFLSEVKAKTGVSLTLYANRGYLPEGLETRFPEFRIANERETIIDVIKAAKVCKQGGIVLDADVTGSDEAMTNAAALEIKSDFAGVMGRFNMAQETAALLEWLSRGK